MRMQFAPEGFDELSRGISQIRHQRITELCIRETKLYSLRSLPEHPEEGQSDTRVDVEMPLSQSGEKDGRWSFIIATVGA